MIGLLLTYLLAYGGAAVALFNPLVGVCVYWIFDIVRPQYMYLWAGASGSYSLIIAIATIVGWAAKGFGSWRFGRGRALVVFFILFTCWALVSAAAAPNQTVALGFVVELLKRTVMFAIAVSMADSVPGLKALAWSIAGAAGVLSAQMNHLYLQGRNMAHQQGYGGMDNNSLAISLVTCFPLALFLGLYVRPWWQKALAFSCAALIGHTVLLTFSRGGLLGLMLSGVAAFAVMPKRPRYLAVAAIALAIGLRFAGPELRDRFNTTFADERDYSAESRIELWGDCLEVVARYPVLGAGPDHFPLVAADFGWPEGKEAHSLWLQVAAEVGVPGVLAMILMYLLAISRMWRFAHAKPTSEIASWAQCAACIVVASLTGFAVSAQFVTIEGLETPLYVVALAVGTLRLTSTAVPAEAAAPIASTRPVGFPGTAGATLARRSVLSRHPGA